MKGNLGEPISIRYLPGQLKLFEEAVAALIQRCEIIKIDAAVYAKQILGKTSGN